MVIHEPYHFQFPEKVLPLPSLVKKHQKTNPDSDERISHDCEKQSLRVLVQPEIRQTSKREDAKAHKDAPQRSNPTRTCTGDNHRGYFATVRCYWPKIKAIPTCGHLKRMSVTLNLIIVHDDVNRRYHSLRIGGAPSVSMSAMGIYQQLSS